MKTPSEIAAVRPMPKTFRLCVKTDCPRAAECLHHVALSLVSPDEPTIPVINPAYLAATEGDCPLFHSATPVRYAQGFVKMLSGLTVAQANALRMRLESPSATPSTFACAQANASSILQNKPTYAKR